MVDQRVDDTLFDYKLYRFGQMQQVFRGPVPDLGGRYVAFLGGSGTFGRYSEEPYADLVGQSLGLRYANFGAEGAGPTFFLSDPEVMSVASDARLAIVQVMPASALSNRMFSVRPRRNGRLHAASELLSGIYPEIDFSRFSHVRGMLRHLARIEDNRFRLVVNEMRNAWIARTHMLLANIQTRTLLFWFSQRAPEDQGDDPTDTWHDPNFVDRAMIDSVTAEADGYVECVTSDGMPQDLTIDGEPVLFRPTGAPINENRDYPSPQMHAVAAAALTPAIEKILRS